MKFTEDFNPGGYPDRPDNRDYSYNELVMGDSGEVPEIDWEKGFDVEKELEILLLREMQGSSLSCVGQAWGKYTEVLDFIETEKPIDHSAKSIYEQIFLPQGGAYLRDGAKTIVKGGIATEKDVPSYPYVQLDDGRIHKNPPLEDFMRQQTITDEIREKMKIYQAKEYRKVQPTSPEILAHAIMNNWGAVSGARGDNAGWAKKIIVEPPSTDKTWGHAYYDLAFGIDEKGKWFDLLNSWGDRWGNNGRGRMYWDEYDMAKNTFSIWTLVDKPNVVLNGESDKIRTYKERGKPEIYALSKETNELEHIGGWKTYKKMLDHGWIEPYEELFSLNGFKINNKPFGFIE